MEFEITRVQAAWRAQAIAALEKLADELLAQARADAPFDPTHPVHLREMGRVEVRHTEHAAVVEVVFSGPYAAKQHEHVEYKHPHGGRAKYLESNLKGTPVADRLAQAERELLR